MKYIEAPYVDLSVIKHSDDNLFLAGSISSAEDWQARTVPQLINHCNVFNPRRLNFDVTDPTMERDQIVWEHFHINKVCGKILFWFSHETVAPITLFEYGKVLMTFHPSKIFVGVHPQYQRRNDVYIQTELEVNKSIKIKDNLQDLIEQVRNSYY